MQGEVMLRSVILRCISQLSSPLRLEAVMLGVGGQVRGIPAGEDQQKGSAEGQQEGCSVSLW